MKRIFSIVFAVIALFTAYAIPVFIARAGADPVVTTLAPANHTAKTLYLRLTAYSSSPDETDYNPFYTANGTHVYDGVVASNFLPFGTKIMIPAIFGNKIFTVEDRMAKRFKHTIDIWMTSKAKALFFGVNYANVVVLGTSSPVIAEK
ncbi:MAG: 3D domain-containing protein [Patescibacteria group bacterium]|nr:3D domain-containing protein [Patescibacteria group bacterium]